MNTFGLRSSVGANIPSWDYASYGTTLYATGWQNCSVIVDNSTTLSVEPGSAATVLVEKSVTLTAISAAVTVGAVCQ